MEPLKALKAHGQAVWMDYIRRNMLENGELRRLVEEEGLSGVTSNPAIFQKAIGESADYDSQLETLLRHDPDAPVSRLYEELAMEDIRSAARVLRPTWDASGGGDGFVSLEVSPHLAYDTDATVAEARRLWREVAQPNLMIKVPATQEGIPAIEALLAEGIHVNITLMFSLAHYEAVAQAYLRGLKRSPDPSRVASVASFFVSRIDSKLDPVLEELGTADALALRGTIAVANSKVTYRRFQEIFHGPDFAPLRNRGARPQRVLWASTSTKNPSYRDVLYVEELIGPDTVNTLPPQTVEAFRDHGEVRASLEDGVDGAQRRLDRLADLGVDFSQVTEELQREGVEKFIEPFDRLLAALEEKRREMTPAAAESAG